MPKIILTLLLIASQSLANELPGIKGKDDRQIVSAQEYPWSSVGRVNNGQGKHCSGILIGPKLIITAAHCLWNPQTQKQMPASALRFVAGWERGEYLAVAEITKIFIAPAWQFASPYSLNMAANDWALLELSSDIGNKVGWVGLADKINKNDKISTVGYSQDKKHVLTAHIGCDIKEVTEKNLIMHNCDAIKGNSGSPIIQGKQLLSGIHVATFKKEQETIGAAASVESFRNIALRMGGRNSGNKP